MPSERRAGSVAIVACCCALAASSIASEPVVSEREDPSHWELLGSFRGSTSSSLVQQANDLLFETENDGDLYQDLGDFSLGLGFDLDDAKFDWDNAFHRRIFPLHEDLPPGSTVTAEDVSRYVDVQSAVSRGRLRFDLPPDVVGDFLVGFEAEGGSSLILARSKPALVYGRRPLAAILAERDQERFPALEPNPYPVDERGLLHLTAQGVAALGRGIARGFRKTADTERGAIFYDGAAEPLTLFFDLGAPVPAEMFTTADPRLAVGDRVRHVTFVGFSPLLTGLRKFGVETGYRNFFRFLRETTIVKEEGGRALVKVRNVVSQGHEFLPFKIRPEIRLLGIIKLGYTFFEQRNDRAQTASSEIVYRIDLEDPRALASFRTLLGEGGKVIFAPLAARARASEGVEILDSRVRRGGQRLRSLRARLFSPWRFRDRKTIVSERIEAGGHELDDPSGRPPEVVLETVVARSRELRKRWGRERNWRRQFLLGVQRDPRPTDRNGKAATQALSLLSAVRDERPSGTTAKNYADLMAYAIAPHPVLAEVAATPPEDSTRFFLNLRLSFGPAHLHLLERIGDEDLWRELAAILLGEAWREAWASAEERRRWRRRGSRREYEELSGPGESVADPNQATTDDVHRRLSRAQSDWIGAERLLEPPDARLRGGSLYLQLEGEDGAGDRAGEAEPCWKLRLFSDQRFSPELALRLDLRQSKGAQADLTLDHALFDLGPPTEVIETPFMTARYFYDVALPPVPELGRDRGYTLLMRVLNPDGLPVTEEQQVRFEWPGYDRMPVECRPDSASPHEKLTGNERQQEKSHAKLTDT